MINIDNNEFFELFKFPGGEWGIKWKKEPALSKFQHLLARLNSCDDVFKLLTVADGYKRMGFELEVTIPYFPGARQDRVANFGEALSVKIYADLINSCGFRRVNIADAHSDVTPALLNNCNILGVSHILYKIVTEGQYNVILIPDAGCSKKVFSYYFPTQESRHGLQFVQCLKKRDTLTGKLSGFQVTESIRNNARCLIVDDIIDGAGTFIGLAEHLKNGSYGWSIDKLGLYGTHGIFSRGINCLFEQRITGAHGYSSRKLFDNIYTTNSIRDNQPDGVTVYNI